MRSDPVLIFSFSVLAQDHWFVTREGNGIHHLTSAPTHPPALRNQSNQPSLICYNRGPSGPYYSNPRDVIPKHSFLLSGRRTILHLTTDERISSLFLLHFLLLLALPRSVTSAGHKVIALLDHFINNRPMANHQHREGTRYLLSC